MEKEFHSIVNFEGYIMAWPIENIKHYNTSLVTTKTSGIVTVQSNETTSAPEVAIRSSRAPIYHQRSKKLDLTY